jgi:hypothetical protein
MGPAGQNQYRPPTARHRGWRGGYEEEPDGTWRTPCARRRPAVLARGCSTYGRTEAAAQPRTTLTVENLTTADMTMYVRFGGARSRLGIARSNGRTVLPIPSSVVGFGTVLRFESNAVAGPGGTLSEEMSVSPGDSVHILIAR